MKKKKDSQSDNITWVDIINDTKLFMLVLNKKLNVNLINLSLASLLGFKNIQEPIGKYWLDFIKFDEKIMTKIIYNKICNKKKENSSIEITNHIIVSNKEVSIKWINTCIDSNMILSLGIFKDIIKIEKDNNKITDINSFRNYYNNIIQKDRMMIKTYQNEFNALV